MQSGAASKRQALERFYNQLRACVLEGLDFGVGSDDDCDWDDDLILRVREECGDCEILVFGRVWILEVWKGWVSLLMIVAVV